MQNFKGMLAEFYDQASLLLGLPDISFSPIDFIEILIIFLIGFFYNPTIFSFIIFYYGSKAQKHGICLRELL